MSDTTCCYVQRSDEEEKNEYKSKTVADNFLIQTETSYHRFLKAWFNTQENYLKMWR